MSGKLSLTWRPIVAPLLGGAASAFFIPLAVWSGITTGLLVVLSVSTAAILVRLARPIPFTNPSQFLPQELDKLSTAMRSISRSLRMLVYVCLATMTAVIVLPQPSLPSSWPALLLQASAMTASAAIGAMVAFVVARLSQVVESDISLIELQGELLQQAAKRAQVKAQQPDPTGPAPPIAGSKQFGKPLHS